MRKKKKERKATLIQADWERGGGIPRKIKLRKLQRKCKLWEKTGNAVKGQIGQTNSDRRQRHKTGQTKRMRRGRRNGRKEKRASTGEKKKINSQTRT